MSSAERLLSRKNRLPLNLYRQNNLCNFYAPDVAGSSFEEECDSLADCKKDREMIREYATEVAMNRRSSIYKNSSNSEVDHMNENAVSRAVSKSVTDYDLFLSAMKKVSSLQYDIAKKTKELEASEKLVRRLEDEIRVLHIAQESTLNDSHECTCLRRQVSELQKKVRDMEEFLADYGLIWLGPGASVSPRTHPASSLNATTIEISGRSLSNRTFDLLLLSIQNLNASIQADEAKIIYAEQTSTASSGSRIARLGRTEPVPLTLYADGIIMFAGPFRCYTQTSTLQLLQDILDGFFPSELQARYPDGVPLLVSDRRTEWYQDPEADQPGEDPELRFLLPRINGSTTFLGEGHRLGGDARVSRLVKNSPQVVTPRMDVRIRSEHSSTRITPSLNEDQHQDRLPSASSRCTLNELLAHLPTSKSPNLRIPQKPPPAINEQLLSNVLADTDWSVGDTPIRIRSPSGQNVYDLTVSTSDSIGHLCETLEKLLPPPLHFAYRLVWMQEPQQQPQQPPGQDGVVDSGGVSSRTAAVGATSRSSGLRRVVLSDRNQTLEHVGIRGSCVLFLELEDTRVERDCGTSPIFEPLAKDDLA